MFAVLDWRRPEKKRERDAIPFDEKKDAEEMAKHLNEMVYDNGFGQVIPRTKTTQIKGPFYVAER